MDETLFNTLFDRKIHNCDYLRGRVACCIKPLSDKMEENLSDGYVRSFYKATISYNQDLVNHFGLDFLKQTKDDFINFRDHLFELFNSNNIYIASKTDYSTYMSSYYKFAEYVGYSDRSRMLKRFFNFKVITNNFKEEKITIKDFRNEILNQAIFFDDLVKKIFPARTEDLCIYYFVYDIRASENARKLTHQKKKYS